MSTPSSSTDRPPKGDPLRLLFVADVVGRPGRSAVSVLLPPLIEERSADVCILNADNAAGGAGLTRKIAHAFFDRGVDVLTSGNHIWDNRDVLQFIDKEPRLLRPANYPPGTPGRGCGVFETSGGTNFMVVNLMGRVFMKSLDCPFRAVDEILDSDPDLPALRILDFHAEATSEKIAMGWYADGRMSAVIGTHTHVVTADERVLPNGTAYITDVGMTGPHESVIGVTREAAIARMISQRRVRFEPAVGDVRLSGLYVECDRESGRAVYLERIQRSLEE